MKYALIFIAGLTLSGCLQAVGAGLIIAGGAVQEMQPAVDKIKALRK